MSKSLLDSLVDSLVALTNTPERVGKRGEKLTERELKLVNFFGRGGRILRNVYLLKDNGETSEIDVLYITQRGIFVIESKNYSGWIFGKEKDRYWTAVLANQRKERFYNPILQNKTHMKWLGQYIGENVPLFSMIVFSERCELKKVTVVDPEITVVKRDRLYAAVRDIYDSRRDVLSETQVNELFEMLKSRTLKAVGELTKQEHIDHIKETYREETSPEKKPTKAVPDTPIGDASETHREPIDKSISAAEETNPDSQSKIAIEAVKSPNDLRCPRCGRALDLRTAKKGPNAGKQFYGCSNFPSCRYIQNLD